MQHEHREVPHPHILPTQQHTQWYKVLDSAQFRWPQVMRISSGLWFQGELKLEAKKYHAKCSCKNHFLLQLRKIFSSRPTFYDRVSEKFCTRVFSISTSRQVNSLFRYMVTKVQNIHLSTPWKGAVQSLSYRYLHGPLNINGLGSKITNTCGAKSHDS